MHTHQISPQDHAFRAAFEAGGVTPEQFNHEAHVRLAYIYLVESEPDSAVQQMRDALKGFLQRNGIPPDKFHETLTRAWVLAVRHFMIKSGNKAGKKPGNKSGSISAADFIASNPEILDSKIMLTHYSASVLFSADARDNFVPPDLDPIPQPMGAKPLVPY